LTGVLQSFDPANNHRLTDYPRPTHRIGDDDPSSTVVVNSACQLVAFPSAGTATAAATGRRE